MLLPCIIFADKAWREFSRLKLKNWTTRSVRSRNRWWHLGWHRISFMTAQPAHSSLRGSICSFSSEILNHKFWQFLQSFAMAICQAGCYVFGWKRSISGVAHIDVEWMPFKLNHMNIWTFRAERQYELGMRWRSHIYYWAYRAWGWRAS